MKNKSKNKGFWWLLITTLFIGAFLYLLAAMVGDQARLHRIEFHSEITSIDTTDTDTASYNEIDHLRLYSEQ